jgi:hypothetical protein
MDQRAAEKSYGLAGDQLTPAVPWNLPALQAVEHRQGRGGAETVDNPRHLAAAFRHLRRTARRLSRRRGPDRRTNQKPSNGGCAPRPN